MIDLIYRNILTPKELREKRRIDQLTELMYAAASIVNSTSSTRIKNLSDAEIQVFVNEILDEKNETPSIIGVKWEQKSSNLKLILRRDSQDLIVNLVSFGHELAKAFEQKLTSTALCFVADASSGLGSKIIGEVSSAYGEMALIEEPRWMTSIAYERELHQIKESSYSKILFALSRLDAWRVRNEVGEYRTVVFTLPGQSCTASLVPTLQKAFPCERHIFVYDGCIDSVSRGLRLRSNNCSSSTPIVQLTGVQKVDEILQKVPWDKAGLAESWMSSVDTFLKLKHAEKKTGYIPFVCRLGFMMAQIGRLGNGNVDQSELALINLLQYITGSRSRPLKGELLIKAKEALATARETELKISETSEVNLSDTEKGVMEDLAFAHKGILIENKTLMDTVQPRVDWSLKAAKKLTSCACCMPGQGDDEDEEDEDGDNSEVKESMTKKATFTAAPASGYVDGKTMFAFDPSRFTGM